MWLVRFRWSAPRLEDEVRAAAGALGERLKVPRMVQKYAVVDANHVSAPLGATWGNVGRFPGAIGGRRMRRNRRLRAAMRRSAATLTPMRAKTRPTALPRQLRATPTHPTILSLSFSQADAKPAFTLECPLLLRHLSVRRP